VQANGEPVVAQHIGGQCEGKLCRARTCVTHSGPVGLSFQRSRRRSSGRLVPSSS
jgi:hypothetical protein